MPSSPMAAEVITVPRMRSSTAAPGTPVTVTARVVPSDSGAGYDVLEAMARLAAGSAAPESVAFPSLALWPGASFVFSSAVGASVLT